jgi:hypothetical protein
MFLGKCLREETSGETAGRKEGKGGKEGGELTLINTIIKKTKRL